MEEVSIFVKDIVSHIDYLHARQAEDLTHHLSKFKESETNPFKYNTFGSHKLFKGKYFEEFIMSKPRMSS